MHIILITGYAGSGKDVIGSLLQKRGYKRYAFADCVKICSAKHHGFDYNLTQTQDGKSTVVTSIYNNKQATVRTFLIEDSAEAKMIHNDPAFWAKILENIIQIEKPQKVVITDWRYKAEYNHFKTTFDSYFGSSIQSTLEPNILVTIRVLRPGITILDDPSEHELDTIVTDHTIYNTSTIDHLSSQLNQFI